MSLDALYTLIKSQITSEWGSTTLVEYPPSKFSIPATTYIQVSLIPADDEVATIGSTGKNRKKGFVRVILFIPVYLATERDNRFVYLESIKALFNRQRLSQYQFSVPEINYMGMDVSEKWDRFSVNTPWFYTE
jgi:hypothetical protein